MPVMPDRLWQRAGMRGRAAAGHRRRDRRKTRCLGRLEIVEHVPSQGARLRGRQAIPRGLGSIVL